MKNIHYDTLYKNINNVGTTGSPVFYVFPSESETESALAVASEGRLPKRSEAEPPSRVSEMQTKYN